MLTFLKQKRDSSTPTGIPIMRGAYFLEAKQLDPHLELVYSHPAFGSGLLGELPDASDILSTSNTGTVSGKKEKPVVSDLRQPGHTQYLASC